MIYIVILILLFISLFILYLLSENDFILIRKDITMPLMFNNIFLSFLPAFIFGRLFYISDTFEFFILNPIIFFYIIKFQGISIFGTILGIILFHLYKIKDKRALNRILDIVSLSFFPMISLFLFSNPFTMIHFILRLLTFFVFVGIYIYLINSHRKYTLKDGSIYYMIIIIFAHLNVLYNYYNFHHSFLYGFALTDAISLLLVIISFFMIVKNEKKFTLR